MENPEGKTCGDVHDFRAGRLSPLGDKHPLHGEKITCERKANHHENHTGRAADGTEVSWERLVKIA